MMHRNSLDKPFRVAIYSLDHESWACAVIRLISPFAVLKEEFDLQWGVRISGTDCIVNEELLEISDAVVVQRFFPIPPNMPFMESVLSSGKAVVYELDDLLFNMPRDNPYYEAAEYFKPNILHALQRVNAVIVSTPALRREVLKYNSNVFVLPNLIDPRLFFHPLRKMRNTIRVGFAGTLTHASDYAVVHEALQEAFQRYGDKVNLVFMGEVPDSWMTRKNVAGISFDPDYFSYSKKLKQLEIDIALVPLVDNHFNRCKSNIKWLEYSAAGIAGIYSDIEPYGCVKNGVTGFRVKNTTDEWFGAICSLIDNPDKAMDIARAAQLDVLRNYNIEKGATLYADVYREIIRTSIIGSCTHGCSEGGSPLGAYNEESCLKQRKYGVVCESRQGLFRTVIHQALKAVVGKFDIGR